MNKAEIIETLKNKPIAPQKKDPVANSSGTNHRALMRYNAMLDNIAIGAHSQKTVNLNGIDWSLRLLTSKEQNDIRKDVLKAARKDDCFEDFNLAFLEATKIVTRALSPSPFKIEGKEIWAEEDLGCLPTGMLEELYREYIDFDLISTQKPSELSLEDIEAMISVIKKKPEELKGLERRKLLAINTYLLNYCKKLEKIIKPDMNN